MDDGMSSIQIRLTNNSIDEEQSLTNNRHQESFICTISKPSISAKANPLSVRSYIRKALRELNHIIISKSDCISQDNNHEQRQQQKNSFLTNDDCYPKLYDIIRSLSSAINQQHDNLLYINHRCQLLITKDN